MALGGEKNERRTVDTEAGAVCGDGVDVFLDEVALRPAQEVQTRQGGTTREDYLVENKQEH